MIFYVYPTAKCLKELLGGGEGGGGGDEVFDYAILFVKKEYFSLPYSLGFPPVKTSFERSENVLTSKM